MSNDTTTREQDGGEVPGVNQVRLVGHVVAPPEPPPTRQETPPNGDLAWQLDVPRTGRSRDRFDCRSGAEEVLALAGQWDTGALVEVTGRLSRRFFRAGGSTVSRVEVVVSRVVDIPADAQRAKARPPAG